MADSSVSCYILLALLSGAAALHSELTTSAHSSRSLRNAEDHQLKPHQVSLADASTVSSGSATVDAVPVSTPHVEPGATSNTSREYNIIRNYKLRLCNAFAWPEAIEMSRVQEPKLVEYPLPYKACHDYTLPLSTGDELQFKAGSDRIGTFEVRSLPENPEDLLMIVPHRRDSYSQTVVFESHVFKRTGSAQVAVLDVYKGQQLSPIIVATGHVHEVLPYGSVVGLAPGAYDILLGSKDTSSNESRMDADVKWNAAKAPAKLDILKEGNYVVMRTGMGDSAFPEELVAFPSQSGAARGVLQAVLLAALAAWQFALA